MALHINIEDLLSAKKVETDRIEFKAGWNPTTIYRTICAFANDFENLGGGYIVLGVEEDEITKTAKRPVKGLSTATIASIQKEMILLNNSVKPYYAPKLSIEEVDEQQIIVLWVVAGSERPYEVPESIIAKHKTWAYYIRRYASSIEARGEDRDELINLANNIPFDDRSNTRAKIDDISMVLVKDHLKKVGSRLYAQVGKLDDDAILGQMDLLSGPQEHHFPRNVALLMFAETPEKYFPMARVEFVYFPEGEAGNHVEFPFIRGPIPAQIRRTLEFISTNYLKEKVIKLPHQAESIRIWNYPMQAIEEILVNAFYHRDYQQREPIEIRIYPDMIRFINFGGPDRSIPIHAFASGNVRSRRYRNRRLGEFLKELELTEGRATGIPTIMKVLQDNGSPPAVFNTDPERTYFEVELFAHTEFTKWEALKVDMRVVVWDLKGINTLIDTILKRAHSHSKDLVHDIADDIADDIAKAAKGTDIQHIINTEDIINDIADDIASDIAAGIQKAGITKQIETLQLCQQPKSRAVLFQHLKLAKHPSSFKAYIQPLLDLGWLSMIIPGKPTSPNQKYFTMPKGKMVLRILDRKK